MPVPEEVAFEESTANNLANSVGSLNKNHSLQNQIMLFQKESKSIIIENSAYFIEDDLVVDEWKLGLLSNFEDEHSVKIKNENLNLLNVALNIKFNGKNNLLTSIYNKFHGDGAFNKFTEFLKYHNVPYNSSGYNN